MSRNKFYTSLSEYLKSFQCSLVEALVPHCLNCFLTLNFDLIRHPHDDDMKLKSLDVIKDSTYDLVNVYIKKLYKGTWKCLVVKIVYQVYYMPSIRDVSIDDRCLLIHPLLKQTYARLQTDPSIRCGFKRLFADTTNVTHFVSDSVFVSLRESILFVPCPMCRPYRNA